jgi:GNAT superfamily N-acetyltransferase
MYRIAIEDNPRVEDVRSIEEGLYTYNRQFAGADNYQRLTIFLGTADDRLAGGLLGATYWGWLYISILWLEKTARGQRFGTQLLLAAEQEAICRGCHRVHLDTLEFQALLFYERHGYTVFGVLDNHPVGYNRYFLTKYLVAESSAM